jgi:hypothetical protein
MAKVNKNHIQGNYVINKVGNQNTQKERIIKVPPVTQHFAKQLSGSCTEDVSGEQNLYFGVSTSFAGPSRLCVGAQEKQVVSGQSDTGMVFIFDSSSVGWVQTTGVYAPSPASGDQFGYSCAAEGNYLAVGAPMKHISSSSDTGIVYIYQSKSTGWIMEQDLLPQCVANYKIGETVAINLPYVAVGAPSRYSTSGSVWVYKSASTGWIL